MPFPSTPNDAQEVYEKGYGLGWFIGSYREYDWINHGGMTDGFCCDISMLPQTKIGLVILTNSSSDGPYFISCIRNQIFDQLLGLTSVDWLKKSQDSREKAKLALQRELQAFDENRLTANSANPLQSYIGCYEHPAYGVVEITAEDNHLLFSYGKAAIQLQPKSEEVFTGQFRQLLVYGINPTVDFTFFKNPAGEIYKLEIPFEGFRAAKPVTFLRK